MVRSVPDPYVDQLKSGATGCCAKQQRLAHPAKQSARQMSPNKVIALHRPSQAKDPAQCATGIAPQMG